MTRTFFESRKTVIKHSIDRLYEQHRSVINKKLKKFENQKYFKNEIEIRQVWLF